MPHITIDPYKVTDSLTILFNIKKCTLYGSINPGSFTTPVALEYIMEDEVETIKELLSESGFIENVSYWVNLKTDSASF